VFRVSDLPRAVDRAPDELELLSGGQTFRGHRQWCARRTMLRRDDQPADIAPDGSPITTSGPSATARWAAAAGLCGTSDSNNSTLTDRARRPQQILIDAPCRYFFISASPAITVSCDGARLKGSQVCVVSSTVV